MLLQKRRRLAEERHRAARRTGIKKARREAAPRLLDCDLPDVLRIISDVEQVNLTALPEDARGSSLSRHLLQAGAVGDAEAVKGVYDISTRAKIRRKRGRR